MIHNLPRLCVVVFMLLALQSSLFGQGANGIPEESVAPRKLLETFRQRWDDSKWEKNNGSRDGYMRATTDDGWKVRMQTLQSLVKAGKRSIPALEEALSSRHVPSRILAAQTLCFLAPDANLPALVDAAQNDSDPAVRLYAVDAIGMSGKGASIDWDDLIEREQNGDVKKHLKYAKARGDTPISRQVVKALTSWNSQKPQSARVGSKAPDFELATVDGRTVKLSDFRDKQHVVLIFIYGDT